MFQASAGDTRPSGESWEGNKTDPGVDEALDSLKQTPTKPGSWSRAGETPVPGQKNQSRNCVTL